tara:strand:+ start:5040 stop:5393 length:354 start_codon:yes stop_codon:yes gene_type:complete
MSTPQPLQASALSPQATLCLFIIHPNTSSKLRPYSTIEMHQHNDRECTKEGIGGAHWGPVLAYMGKVEDAASADGSGEFFKVYQNGWKKNPAASQGDNDYWGTKDLNYNCMLSFAMG